MVRRLGMFLPVLFCFASFIGCGSSSPATSPTASNPSPLASSPIPGKSQPNSTSSNAEIGSQSEFDSLSSRNDTPTARPPARPQHDTTLEESDRSFKVPPYREWAAKTGGYRVKAKFVRLAENQAELLKEGGQSVKVPMDKLSETDCDYIADLIRVHPKAKVLFTQVVGAFNCETVIVDVGGNWEHVKLHGVVGPARLQPHHEESLKAIEQKLDKRYVWVEFIEHETTHARSGTVYLDGRNMNLELIAEGVVWHEAKECDDAAFKNAEFVASSKKLGVWGVAGLQRP